MSGRVESVPRAWYVISLGNLTHSCDGYCGHFQLCFRNSRHTYLDEMEAAEDHTAINQDRAGRQRYRTGRTRSRRGEMMASRGVVQCSPVPFAALGRSMSTSFLPPFVSLVLCERIGSFP